ncbi:tetratricopeptide repeat protein [Streptomyces sp. NPDC020412]|uniref:tetratricopeptide repeat protein n=1 Tax=Streptomyces sp. NPDC020412 TaxID=3365073 RepID=UPI0037ADED54
MSGAVGGGRRSGRGQGRVRGGFVGREGELRAFAANLDAGSGAPEARFLFHVHGNAGVGKSSLVRRFAQLAQERGALTAVLDESAGGVPEVLAGICAQFGAQGQQLKPVEKLLATYRQRRYEAESAAAALYAPDAGAPAGPNPWAVLVAQASLVGVGAVVPGVGGAVDPVRLVEGAEQLRGVLMRQFGRAEDVQLVLDPVRVISPVFAAEVNRVAAKAPWVALFFDTYERTGPLLDPWLRGLLVGTGLGPGTAPGPYGQLPENVVVTTCGQRPPAPAVWGDHAGLVTEVPLAPFTDAEARELLAAKEVRDEDVVRDVLRLSGRLPVLVSMLAENAARPGGFDDPSATAVERFLKWEHDARRRSAALHGALPRHLDEDVLAVATRQEHEAQEAQDAQEALAAAGLFDWLLGLPFVSDRGGRARYHDVVRDPMLRLQRNRSPKRWRAAHTRLAQAYADWAAEEADGEDSGREETGGEETGWEEESELWAVDAWRAARVEEVYHRLCARPRTGLPAALRDGVRAAHASPAAARQWAAAVADAGTDADSDALRALGAACLAAVADDSRRSTALLGVVVDRAETDDATRCRALLVRARDHHRLGAFDEAAADCRAAIALGADTVAAHHELGEHLRLGRRYEEALAAYDEALARDPDALRTSASRGLVKHRLGRHEEALADLDRAVDADPRYAWALVARSDVKRALGDRAGAIADVSAASEIEPDHASVLASYAETLRHFEQYEEAVALFDRALLLNPDYTWALGSRAMAHHRLGRVDAALADLGEALARNPGYGWALLRRAEIHRERGDAEAEFVDLDRLVQINPDPAPALARRAAAHLHHGRTGAALADVRRMVELGEVAGALAVLAEPAFAEVREARELAQALAPTPACDPGSDV